MSVFTLRDITYTYETTQQKALSNLNLTIQEGYTTAVLGPNGAGKSTLMDILLSFRKPTEGTIRLFEKDLSSYTKEELGRIVGLVPQEERSRFAFTLFEFVLFGRAPYLHHMKSPDKNDHRIAEASLREVGLFHLAHRQVTSLSGGEHQLLLLARVLAQKPQVILLDEPTSSLDPANTAKVLSILRSMKQSGTTLLMTTHDPTLASDLADEVIMLKQGALLHHGPCSLVLTSRILSELYSTSLVTIPYGTTTLVARGE